MTIIDRLEQTVTPAVLGQDSSVNHISLLEQFYAILIMHLAAPNVYTELQRTELSNDTSFAPEAAHSSLFEQLWQQPDQRRLLLQELAATHHIDESVTEQTIVNATSHIYQALKTFADGQYLPAFLQAQQAEIREYLPVWSSEVISTSAEHSSLKSDAVVLNPIINSEVIDPEAIDPEVATTVQPLVSDITTPEVTIVNNEAIPVIRIDKEENHTNLANHSQHHMQKSAAAIPKRNLLIPLLLGLAALLAAGLIWALFFKTANTEVAEPVIAEPVITAPEVAPPVLTPAQLAVGVDDSGNLYHCSGAVGDSTLQASLIQTLMTSFGEQANICEVTVQEGIATTLQNMDAAVLPNILMLMRAAPFSRLQLQNNSITLEAPDNQLLQRLVADVSALVPTMPVTAIAPAASTGLAQPPANTYDDTYNNDTVNNGDNGNINDAMNNNENYNDSPMPNTAMPNNSNTPMNNTNNNSYNQPPPQNNVNNIPANNRTNQNPGGMSLAEVEDLANNPIVSEPAKGGRPIN